MSKKSDKMDELWHGGEFWTANIRNLIKKGGLSESGALEIMDIIDRDPVNRYFIGKDD